MDYKLIETKDFLQYLALVKMETMMKKDVLFIQELKEISKQIGLDSEMIQNFILNLFLDVFDKVYLEVKKSNFSPEMIEKVTVSTIKNYKESDNFTLRISSMFLSNSARDFMKIYENSK